MDYLLHMRPTHPHPQLLVVLVVTREYGEESLTEAGTPWCNFIEAVTHNGVGFCCDAAVSRPFRFLLATPALCSYS